MTKELQEAIEAIKKADWTEPMDYVGIPIKTLITAAQESIHLETVAAEMAEEFKKIIKHQQYICPAMKATCELIAERGLNTYQTTIKKDERE